MALVLLPVIHAQPNPLGQECDTDDVLVLKECLQAARALLPSRPPAGADPRCDAASDGTFQPSFEEQTRQLFHRVTGNTLCACTRLLRGGGGGGLAYLTRWSGKRNYEKAAATSPQDRVVTANADCTLTHGNDFDQLVRHASSKGSYWTDVLRSVKSQYGTARVHSSEDVIIEVGSGYFPKVFATVAPTPHASYPHLPSPSCHAHPPP